MTDALQHRGPDGAGFYEQGPVHLGHRRLSIIDIDGSSQPMADASNSVFISFNGEIFNFKELRADLRGKGYTFRTAGDTETIIYAYKHYGETFLDHLQGQFALALWDSKRETLILARDRMGQLPLYYFQPDDKRIYFGSELKALLRHKDIKPEVSINSLSTYLGYMYIPEPLSIYKDIYKLPCAHKLIFSRSGSRLSRYWYPPFGNVADQEETDVLVRLDALLSEAVRCRMVSDVPLGAFLSGGIDSSLVVAYMATNSVRPVKTFSIGFEQDSHDERKFARLVANRFRTEHHEFVVTPAAADVIPKMAAAFDEPFADSSALPFYYLAMLTRQHVTVALNGDGGDESFAGYRRYFATRNFELYRRLPRSVRAIIASTAKVAAIGPLRENALFRRLNRWRHLETSSLGLIYQQAVEWPLSERLQLIAEDLRSQLNEPCRLVADAVDRSPGNDILNRIMHGDQQTYLPSDLLVKADRMCMAHSLEPRSPFLDHRVVEFAARLPSRIKAPHSNPKNLLKRLLRKYFPPEFVNRKKMGFAVPISKWFRESPYLNDIINTAAQSCTYLDGKRVKSLQSEHHKGTCDHSSLLWAIVMLAAWQNNSSATP